MTESGGQAKKPVLLQGNEAMVEGALAAGCRFFAGYPITPATEISEVMSIRLPAVGGTFIQMEDEIASMGAVIGASLAGAKAMTATSGPGFSLMQENIGFACAAEVPCVVVNVMRGGPSTGLPTNVSQEDVMQARWGAHGDHPIIVLAVSGVQDCFDLTVKAFNVSEAYRTPVVILSDEVVSHTREKFIIPEASTVQVINREKPEMPPEWYIPYEDTRHGVPPMGIFGDGYRYHVTGLIHDVRGFPTQRPEEILAWRRRLFRKIYQHLPEIQFAKTDLTDNTRILVVAYGSVARSARRAVREARQLGVPAGLLHLQTLWPFPERLLEPYLVNVRAVLVPELNLGQIYQEVLRVNQGETRIVPLNRIDGNLITPEEIVQQLVKL
ncbi:2-oxoacid:acceptor oxidoreductase subunit alpha [Desulfobacca acetoxidans]|uniref:2-oxoglutarate synthase n=1 Tax=Desulfobacca acetoxidans (strain ATCC 700848 / DSM 11109 / ASRB2) TaxID=880072 RepID=F2NI43_DESAR|nr:2-oxoacid:acceptor oxidoreductase subunit alpha [Desulfobacca acetoxidans]AEB09669.1 2-oxoglutarate synthase [Desulfobacca acetoxidans DSM 11109]